MNLEEAKQQVLSIPASMASRPSWGKVIRAATVADNDFLPDVDLTNAIMEDCEKKENDCKTGIFRPTEDDLTATDYYIV